MKARRFLFSAAALSVLLMTGCVMPDQMSQIQKDLADVRQRLQRVEREQGEALDKLTELESRAGDDEETVTREDLADVSVQLNQLAREAAITDERLNDLGRRLDRFSQDQAQARNLARRPAAPAVPAGGPETGEPESVPPHGGIGAVEDPQLLYNTAYADFSKGNYGLAISGFEEYYDRYPTNSLADNALYWVGECNFSQGEFSRAIEAFDRLLERFPDSDKAASGDLKKGLAYLEQNQVGKAIVQFQHVHDRYGGTDEARVARDRLSALGVSI